MKKILILLSFLSVFVFSATIEYQYDMRTLYNNASTNPADIDAIECPSGQGLKLYLVDDDYIYTTASKNYYNSVNVVVPNIYNLNGTSSIFRSAYFTETSTSFALRQVVQQYHCASVECPDGQNWINSQQTCGLVCKPWQRLNEINGGYAYECEDMCPTLDTYTPLTGVDWIDGAFGGLFPWDSSTCKTNPAVSENECNAHQGEGYHWVCPEANPISILFGYMTGGPTHDDCYCGNEYKSYPPAVPYFGPGKPLTSPKIDPKALPWSNYPKLAESLSGMSDDALDAFSDWLKYQERKGGSTDVPEAIPPKNYDYTDTHIERDPVTGKETFVPDFTETPSTTGSPSITANGFADNIRNNPVVNDIDRTLPQTSTPISPESYTAGWQTATKTEWNLPETFPAGSLVTTETVPTNLTGGTIVKPYNWDVTNPTPTTTRYTSNNGDTTTTVTVDTDGSSARYTVNTSTPYTGSDGRQYTNNNSYGYTVSGGTTTYTNPSTSTTTLPDGTTYTNPSTNTNYNYNTDQQNLDELLNFKPTVTDTAMKKPLDELITKQGETLDFIDSLKNSINGIKLDFDAMMFKLQNPPILQPKSGNCVMTAVWHGNTITANPCTAFYPYREMISLFLTIVGMFFVGKFAVENLK